MGTKEKVKVKDRRFCFCFRFCPYGPIICLPLIFVTASVVFTLMVTFGCNYMEVSPVGQATFTIGPWRIQKSILIDNITEATSGCEFWSEANAPLKLHPTRLDVAQVTYQDTRVEVARISSAIGSAMAILLTLVVLMAFCVRCSRGILICFSFFCFLNSIFMGLTLLMQNSDICISLDGCVMNTEFYLALISTMFWIFAGISLIFLPAPRYWKVDSKENIMADKDKDDDEDEEEEEEKKVSNTEKVVEEVCDQRTGIPYLITTVTTYYGNGNQKIIETRQPKNPYASLDDNAVEDDDETADLDSSTIATPLSPLTTRSGPVNSAERVYLGIPARPARGGMQISFGGDGIDFTAEDD